MYVTRPLSLYKNSPESLSEPPAEGLNSGYLVVQDEEFMTPFCFDLCKIPSDYIEDLPLPSNKILKVDHNLNYDSYIFAIPVINQPLSANRYYAIKAHSHEGEAYACSKKEDKVVGCSGRSTRDARSRTLDPQDIYQQIEFCITTGCNDNAFVLKSVAPDGHPPRFARSRQLLNIRTSRRDTKDFIQREATGLNSSLRARLPDFSFPLSREFSMSVCVGKWYCPFMFIHEGKLKDQVRKSVYYNMRLEQCWERIFTCERGYLQGNKVVMDVVVPTQVITIGGKAAVRDGRSANNKAVWFRGTRSTGEEISVGLSSLIFERMIWEQSSFGWVNGTEKQVRVVREEKYEGNGGWAKFGCYVLVERYVLQRMDGSLVMTYDFKHTHQIKTKWE